MAESSYKTKQRSMILECLKKNSDKAFTAEEIAEFLKQSGKPIGKATVYRYINSLTKAGALRRFVPEGEKSATYQFVEHIENCKSHIHLKCVGCGKLIHLECGIVDEMLSHIMREHGFTVDKSKTTVLGLCKDCAEREEKDETH